MKLVISMSFKNSTVIKTHKELASEIAGKCILHLNSYGKDSIVCLDWLASYAHPSKIISVNLKYETCNPDDAIYLEYLKKRYPEVTFIEIPNPYELSHVLLGNYQEPISWLREIADLEHDMFDADQLFEDLRVKFECDFICMGRSRYESFARACFFHKKGILVDKMIYPIGMMSKSEVIGLIRGQGIKLHPCYGYAKSTLDNPSWFKYRAAFKKYPDYEKKMLEMFPLLELDKFRYEVLFGKK